MFKYILASRAQEDWDFSIEAGMSDGHRCWDHHGIYVDEPCPCEDERIGSDQGLLGDKVGITHMDADTFVGILRLANRPLPEVDFRLMAHIDRNGSTACPDPLDPTLLYMVGLKEKAREIKFPRCTPEPQDVTPFILQLMAVPPEELIELGAAAQQQVSHNFAVRRYQDKVGLWLLEEGDSFDPSYPYRWGTEVVVVWRAQYKSISIYASPASNHAFAGRAYAGVAFAGHPKACGSARGVECGSNQAIEVYKAITAEVEK